MEIYIKLSDLNKEIEAMYEKSCNGDWSCLNDLKKINLPSVEGFWVYQVIMETMFLNLRMGEKTEMDIHNSFKKNFKKILGKEYKISDFKSNQKYQPDVWISKDSEQIPVEIKLYAFTDKSLSQLLRYMKFYNAKHGIAVARELKCELPDNITFINYKDFADD